MGSQSLFLNHLTFVDMVSKNFHRIKSKRFSESKELLSLLAACKVSQILPTNFPDEAVYRLDFPGEMPLSAAIPEANFAASPPSSQKPSRSYFWLTETEIAANGAEFSDYP